jgi:membrane protein DedA with SNARE-associated domain
MSIEGFAAINVVGILIWIGLCVLIAREYKKRKAGFSSAPAA